MNSLSTSVICLFMLSCSKTWLYFFIFLVRRFLLNRSSLGLGSVDETVARGGWCLMMVGVSCWELKVKRSSCIIFLLQGFMAYDKNIIISHLMPASRSHWNRVFRLDGQRSTKRRLFLWRRVKSPFSIIFFLIACISSFFLIFPFLWLFIIFFFCLYLFGNPPEWFFLFFPASFGLFLTFY